MNSSQIFNSPEIFETIQEYLIPESPEITEEDKQRDIDNFIFLQREYIKEDYINESLAIGLIDLSHLYLTGDKLIDEKEIKCTDCGQPVIICDNEGPCTYLHYQKEEFEGDDADIYCKRDSFISYTLYFEKPTQKYSFQLKGYSFN